MFEIDWVISIPENRKNTIFSQFLANRGPKIGQSGSKANQLWTVIQLVYTSSFKWTEWSDFQLMVGKHYF